MRIHTSADYFQIRTTVTGLQGVYIETLEQHGSKTHPHAFELQLSGNGRFASQYGDRDTKSATWDEWGYVMARIFALDPQTRMGGSTKRPIYADAEDFRWQTNGRFGGWYPHGGFVAEPMPTDTHPVHRWEWLGTDATKSYSVSQCKRCSALKRWKIPERIPSY